MYELLIKMKKKFPYSAWLKMVDQARKKKKITEEEYQELIAPEEEA
uniref:Short C-terminal domain n=1 Tax=Siphoviridae sp. ctbbV81 TaxID=2827900 RepID=A0A8S5TQF3_9CAUD|nr:MAG TPA: Short C-terminal domain [Siphoviridae sp. ctbbV81]